ncbi:LuxR C-terminal-related transcriptional regulator [Propionicicella superfundia]|uniref:LuxR C-terminal-related transcriptional regulator n=1 Tax=Propionicicella superfundia TaxID=348582 RepID=UPI0012EB5FBE|nr:LuxR C-terminal-related transcriptional regulator [Propionicicella superfundia]
MALFADVVERAVGFVSTGINVHLVGPPLSGRTTILNEIENRLSDEGRNIHRVNGNLALKNDPLTALIAAGLAKDASVHALGESISTVGRLIATRNLVLLCDEADMLDNRSAGVLLGAVRDSKAVLVTTSGSLRAAPSNALVVSPSPSVSLRVGSLDQDQLQQLATAIVGAPLVPADATELLIASGGLYGLARTILVVGKQTGRIVPDSAKSMVAARGGLWSEELEWTAEHLLMNTSDELRRAAAEIALHGSLPWASAEELLGRETMTKLVGTGLLHTANLGAATVVGLYPGILTDYFRQRRSSLSRDRGHRGVAVPGAEAETVDLTAELDAADVSLISRQELAEARLATQSRWTEWVEDRTVENALPLVVAMENSSESSEAIRHVIAETPIQNDDLNTALFVLWTASWIMTIDDDLDTGLAIIHRHRSSLPSFEGFLRGAEAALSFLRDRWPAPQLLADPAPDADPFNREYLAGVRIQLQIAGGRTASAGEAMAAYSPSRPSQAAQKTLWEALNAILDGRVEEGTALALSSLRANARLLSVGSMEAFEYAGLLGLVVSGRLHEAEVLLHNVMSTTLSSTFRYTYHAGILCLGALVSSWQGKHAYSRALSSQALSSTTAQGPFPGIVPKLVGSVTSAARDRRASASEAWHMASERLASGYLASAYFAALEAGELGPDQWGVTDQINASLGDVESPLLAAVGRYVIATHEEDRDALTACIEDFVGMSATLFATKAAVTLAVLQHQNGEPGLAAATAAEAWDRAVAAGHGSAHLFDRLRARVSLSAREQEILNLAAEGLTYADIGSLLGLSGRTAEAHLQNVSKKVGTTGRDQLFRASATWLLPSAS